MTSTQKDLDAELDTILETYNENDIKTYKAALTKFEKDCIKLTEETFPQFKLPIYISIADFDNPVPNSLAYWADTQDLSPEYSNLNDNYCRNVYGNDNYVYPVRNPNTGVISLKSCNTIINDELKDMLDLKNELSIMISQARNALFKNEKTNANNSKQIIDTLNKKLNEYEVLQTQYIQTLKLIKNFDLLLKDKREDIDKKELESDTIENEFNITRDVESINNIYQKQNKKLNSKLLLYTKLLLFICWLLVLGLFAMLNINKIIT